MPVTGLSLASRRTQPSRRVKHLLHRLYMSLNAR
jgi:hypothetical protein